MIDKITLQRVDITTCTSCIFYLFEKSEKGGCVMDHDNDQDPFACVVDDKHMMWIEIKEGG